MRDYLNSLYRTYSCRSGITPNQSQALAGAACVLGSRGIPAGSIRHAIEELQAAFENPSIEAVIAGRPIFLGFISELSRA